MTEPTEGIAVSYAETQNSHSRNQLGKVVSHALSHDGFVGGWLNTADGLYYFDSTKLFPENKLGDAIRFGKENCQHSVFILSTFTDIPVEGKVAEIIERGTLLIGTTGDYRPLSFREGDGTYWGFGIEVAKEIAGGLGVGIEFVKTSWPTLTADVLADPQTFDFAIGGITITDARRETMLMSDGYLANGKTILCRASERDSYKSLADIDKPGVRVMVNPGGLNEKFANEHLTHATILVHQKNEEIPALIAEGKADVMITEITEAPYYVQSDPRLAAPLLNEPFTHGEIGVLMQKGQEDLLQMVNNTIQKMKSDGTLRRLHEKYGLVYAY
jgi:ABC-type amino acid transport substrate-binding protein